MTITPDHYNLEAGCSNGTGLTLASSRCSLPGWGYEVFTGGAGISAWDGKEWFSPGYAPRDPPPYFVHVLVLAAALPPPGFEAGALPARGHPITDSLLNPHLAPAAVSFGWVRWYGVYGRLVLISGEGEEAGHLIFHFKAGGVSYDISLHAWASKERTRAHGAYRVIRAPEPGPALTHVIATLKAIVDSILTT